MDVRLLAANTARRWIDGNAVIVDTETTGLDRKAQVIEVAVIDCAGRVLLDERVRPTVPIPPEATQVHDITDWDVRDAKTWPLLQDRFREAVAHRCVVIFNSSYDVRILRQTSSAHGLRAPLQASDAECAMRAYADYFHGYSGGRWIGLAAAARQAGVPVGGLHTALSDCRMTLGVIMAMARH